MSLHRLHQWLSAPGPVFTHPEAKATTYRQIYKTVPLFTLCWPTRFLEVACRSIDVTICAAKSTCRSITSNSTDNHKVTSPSSFSRITKSRVDRRRPTTAGRQRPLSMVITGRFLPPLLPCPPSCAPCCPRYPPTRPPPPPRPASWLVGSNAGGRIWVAPRRGRGRAWSVAAAGTSLSPAGRTPWLAPPSGWHASCVAPLVGWGRREEAETEASLSPPLHLHHRLRPPPLLLPHLLHPVLWVPPLLPLQTRRSAVDGTVLSVRCAARRRGSSWWRFGVAAHDSAAWSCGCGVSVPPGNAALRPWGSCRVLMSEPGQPAARHAQQPSCTAGLPGDALQPHNVPPAPPPPLRNTYTHKENECTVHKQLPASSILLISHLINVSFHFAFLCSLICWSYMCIIDI